jgi:hypothetical protein
LTTSRPDADKFIRPSVAGPLHPDAGLEDDGRAGMRISGLSQGLVTLNG